MTKLYGKQYMEELWTDEVPEDEGLYLVTFLSTRGDREFRGLDLVECTLDEKGRPTWHTGQIQKRMQADKVEIIAWMDLPEVAE